MSTKVTAIWPENEERRKAIARALRSFDCDYFIREGQRWAHVITPGDRHGASTPPTLAPRSHRRWISIKPPSPSGGPKGVA